MRTFLLTWYGITDFRASLGFENTDGPIAAALAAEAYSDVVILCYTRADNDSNECVEAQNSFAANLASIRDAGQEKDWKTTGDFVSRFANTAIAHEHFIGWLKAKIQNANGSVQISFKSEKLRELNDTEGIYACAMRALDWVAQEAGEKRVTLYLSPGTPVMAFVWAFAALGHPALTKRLIASPVIGKPPETISLPAEWLERHGATQEATRDATNGFDVTFHLFGEQRMPALLGIRQFESRRHIFVNSKEYPAKCMRAFIRGGGFDELPVDPWDASAVREQIIHHAEKLPANAHIGVNLTGGTKLMFAGALAAARALGAAPFYFDSRNRRVTFVDNFRSASIKPIDSVETFLLLHGDELKLSKNGVMPTVSPTRRLLTETLWKHRGKIANHYKELCNINDCHEKLLRKKAAPTPFKVNCNGLVFELDKKRVATVAGGGLDLRFENWPGFAKYLSGGWFEEYAYLHFKPYEDAGVIKDLRINVELLLDQKYAERFPRWDTTHNELDVAFTDGHSLYIVECKAGTLTQEQVMKLQNLVRFYGGVEGRGIAACCFPPNAESVRKKLKDAKLTLCCGETFSKQVEALMNGIAECAEINRGIHMRLHLVCDISGSMGDGGKPFTMRTAVMAIAHWVRLGYARAEIRLCGWASETRPFLNWSTKDEFPTDLLSCGGPSNGEALIQWLGEKPEGKVLLLTDGFWAWNEEKVLKHWMECLPPDTLRVIKIGADANPQLKGPNVFAAEELFLALDDWLEGDVA